MVAAWRTVVAVASSGTVASAFRWRLVALPARPTASADYRTVLDFAAPEAEGRPTKGTQRTTSKGDSAAAEVRRREPPSPPAAWRAGPRRRFRRWRRWAPSGTCSPPRRQRSRAAERRRPQPRGLAARREPRRRRSAYPSAAVTGDRRRCRSRSSRAFHTIGRVS